KADGLFEGSFGFVSSILWFGRLPVDTEVRFRQRAIRKGERIIARDSFFKQVGSLDQSLQIIGFQNAGVIQQLFSPGVEIVCFEMARGNCLECAFFSGGNSGAESFGDLLRHLCFDCEQIATSTIVSLRPEMIVCSSVN